MGLDAEQVNDIKETWSQISKLGLTEVGLVILNRLFTQEPNVRSLFYGIHSQSDDISLDSLRENSRVVSHASNLGSAIAKIIALIEKPDELKDYLEELGEIHKFHNVPPQNFDLLGPILLGIIKDVLGSSGTESVMNAWKIAYVDVIKKVIVSVY